MTPRRLKRTDNVLHRRPGITFHLPTRRWDTGGRWNLREGNLPSLVKEGTPRRTIKCHATSKFGAAGHERSECEPDRAKPSRVVRSAPDNRRWNQPPRLRPAKVASQHLLNGRSHPSFTKEGNTL